MKIRNITLLAGLLAAFASGTANGQTLILSDFYNVSSNLTGFALGEGVNSGINPPTTRLSGTAADGLRYFKYSGAKANSAHAISGDKFRIARIATDSSTVSLSPGTGLYDFAPALNTLAATPANKAVYETTIKISNAATGTQRCSFALASTPGTANSWDLGIQLYRATTSDTAYTLQKRISAAAGGVATPINLPVTTVGTYPNEVTFLIRVTDAGAQTDAFDSRVEVFADGTLVYDTSTDFDLPSGFRFPGASRFIYWDAAGGAGPVTFDDFSLTFISGPTAGPRTWTGGGGDDNWSTGANWGGSAPTSGDMLIFNGTSRQVNFNDITGLTVPWVNFNNGGFVLGGGALTVSGPVTNLGGINTFAGDLNWAGTAPKIWDIASGSEIVLDNTNTVDVTGDHTLIGGGTLRVKKLNQVGQITTANPAFVVNEGSHIIDGGTFISRGGYRIGSLASSSGAQTIITNGATFSLTVSGANLRVGDSANPVTSQLLIDNSTLTLAGSAIGLPYAANATGAVVQVGGSVSGGAVVFSDAGAGTGTYSVKNGTLEPTQIREDNAAGVSTITFDNAVLRAGFSANGAAFFNGVDTAEILSGGLIIDGQSDVTIGQVLSGTGTLTKSNYSTVTLTGANVYSGNTVIQGGKLVLPTIQTNATAVQVGDSTELGVRVITPGSTLSIGALSFTGGSFSTLSFDLGAFPTPTAPLVSATSLSVAGPVTINIANGLQLTPGQIVLVDYSGTLAGGFQFSLGSLPSGVSATLVNNTANSSIDLNITAVPGYQWTGAVNGDWDYSTQNWLNKATASASSYNDGFPTEFLDGAANPNVNLLASPNVPVLTASNNITAYTWNAGMITTPILKKYGTNTLTRVSGEFDVISNIELNEGTYAVSPGSDSLFNSVLTGAGIFSKEGSTVLTMTTTNTAFDGVVRVQQGTLKLGHSSNGLGSTNGATIIADGATLDVNDFVAPHEPVFVSGSGVSGLGAIIDSTSGGGVAANFTDVTLLGDTTFGSSGRWDIRVRSGTGVGPGLRGNGFNLTKVGSGAVSIACQRHFSTNQPYWNMNLGDVVINEGSVTFAESLTLDNPDKTITVAPGASLGTYDLGATNPILRTVYISDATITSGGGNPADVNAFDGPLQVTGSVHLRANDTMFVVNGPIHGSGAAVNVSASGQGIVFLNGASTFTGDTTVTNGTLGGTGSIVGNLNMLGGTLSPGYNGVGTFTVAGGAVLPPTTVMELNRALSPNSDRLSVSGPITAGTTLTVVLASGAPAPQGGDVYQLFNQGVTGFTTINLPDLSALPGGLGWDITQLDIDGSIRVTGESTPPNIGTVYNDGGNLVFSGTGGVEGAGYVVLTSTNVALPLVNWTPLSTNVFGPGGSFAVTNSINPAAPTTFFILELQ